MKKILLLLVIVVTLAFPSAMEISPVELGGSYCSPNDDLYSLELGNTTATGYTYPKAEVTVFELTGRYLGMGAANEKGFFFIEYAYSIKTPEAVSIIVKREDEGDKVNHAYINGFPSGEFKPRETLTRGEAAAMVARLAGVDLSGVESTTGYSDVDNKWYSKALKYMSDKEMLKGRDGYFKPEDPITRGDFCYMVAGFVKGEVKASNFKDIKNHYAKDEIDKLYTLKAVEGYGDNTVRPEGNLTRAEAVKILNVAFKINCDERSLKDVRNIEDLKTFTDVKEGDWFYYYVVGASNSYRYKLSGDYDLWTEILN